MPLSVISARSAVYFIVCMWRTARYGMRHLEATMTEKKIQLARAAWSIDEWCSAVAFSKAKFYNLASHQRPATVKIGAQQRVIESPEAYLARLAEAQTEVAA